MTVRPEFPAAKDDDDDDVAWALSTAQVQWKRGSQADAVVWLRRAIDSAVSVGATWRAAELTRETDALEAYLVSGAAAASLAPQGNVAVEDFDGTEMIGDEAMSLPPDDDLDEAPAPLNADSTDELTDVTPDDDRPSVDDEVQSVEVEEEVVEIAEEDIDEDEITDDDLGDGELPRFESEAPTATFNVKGLAAKLGIEEDPAPTPPLPAVEAVPFAYRNPYESVPPPPPPPVAAREPEPSTDSEDVAYAEASTETAADTETTADTETEPNTEAEPDTESAPEVVVEAAPASVPAPVSSGRPPAPELTEPILVGISLAEIRGFEDFPPETQLALAKVARVERLATEEEVSGFGLALVLRGAVNVMPAIADVACGAAGERELVYGRGTLQDGVALRLVATAPDTQIAIWDFDAIEPPLAECPWVLEELENVADRYQALAGVAMGPMGDRLDDSLRGMVLSRCRLVKLLPGEVLVEEGKPVGGLFIVGAGRLDLGNDPARPGSDGQLLPGDFLFAPQVLSAGPAPTVARAGAAGALLMAADRHAAHELMLSVPPLLELLAG